MSWRIVSVSSLSKRLFIFYGLKAFLGKEELAAFYRNAFYEKLDMLLIEPFQRGKPMKEECVTIIDEDLCVLY